MSIQNIVKKILMGTDKSNIILQLRKCGILDKNQTLNTDYVNLVENLLKISNSRFITVKRDLFYIAEGLKLQVQTLEEIYILHEIFYKGDYSLTRLKEYIFIDIGMNVGFTSLYFASKKEVTKTYSFEPVLQTINQAHVNLQNNIEFAKKINTHQFGLSDLEKEIDITFSKDWKGSVGVRNFPTDKKTGLEVLIRINLKQASKVFSSIYNKHPKVDIVVKIDCEGSEYDIISNLYKNKKLERISVFMIEWHEKGPNEIIELLTISGFTCISHDSHTNNVGMIYAFK